MTAFLANPISRACLICGRPANCLNYGVLCCDACKMFYRRTVKENLSYTCKADNKCMEKPQVSGVMCKSCRWNKCVELGMQFTPKVIEIVEQRRGGQLPKILEHLTENDASLIMTLVKFYRGKDPSSEGTTMKHERMPVSPEEWPRYHAHVVITTFMKFSFLENLLFSNKCVLFKNFTIRLVLLGSAMISAKERNRVLTRNRQEPYSDEFKNHFPNGPNEMRMIYGQLVSRMTELKVTCEELVLLQTIFLCNPLLPSLSKKGRSMLYTHQYKYTHLLFKYCEDNYQLSASSRQVDLILLYDIVGKNFEDFQYELYLFPYSPPQFQSKKLTENTIQVDDNMNDANIASFMLNSPDY